MPVYDYKCNTCGQVFEYKQSMSDNALTNCPEDICKSEVKGQGSVQRILSKNVGLVFKGTGFYQTDYTSKGKDSSDPGSTHGCASGACGCGPSKTNVA
ncbi:MAG: zinc ribbon domain-containing protein [Candidatus Kapabacteria bacterium]|nr:zinc ribbon domain-containing protein [Ignavibacteriota bacterium]MCW5884953.1 zinc ribbon domain-containing protein [Candidatus Kapabacteria bacterium]